MPRLPARNPEDLSAWDRFVYWFKERHLIYLRRKEGQPKPWTQDPILQRYFFTNPYREHDRVTVWFRENIREPLRNDPRVFFATVAFRWFNFPETGEVLIGGMPFQDQPDNLFLYWDADRVLQRLRLIRGMKMKVFTGAFMINSPPGIGKLEAIVERIDNVWRDREHYLEHWDDEVTMEGFHEALMAFPGLGGFMAYEIVCDLRYTYLLENAPDKMTWCNPGPGAVRGMYRIEGLPFEKGNNASAPPRPKDWREILAGYLARLQREVGYDPRFPPIEMREIEHALCEADKYMRALYKDGKMKRTYQGV